MSGVVSEDQRDRSAGVEQNLGSAGHAGLSLVGKSKLADSLIADGRSGGGGDHEASLDLFEFCMNERLDPDSRAVAQNLDGPWCDSKLIAKPFRDYHSSGIIDGCFHA